VVVVACTILSMEFKNPIDLRSRRVALGYSQESLAAELGLHHRTYGALERRWPRCRLRQDLALRLAELLGVNADDLQAALRSGPMAE
jgi:DNA-binding XRE family transcriptional regulator